MCRGMEFQSMTLLGINEYFHDFRQFLFVAIWINWLCLDERRTGRRIVCVGMARRPQRAWCTMETLLTFLLSSNDSHSSSFFHFCDTAPTFIVACYETSTRVSKWSYQHLILTPNTWVSFTKEGVPTGPTTGFFVGPYILLLSCQKFWPVLFLSVTLMDTLLLTPKKKK